jgi:hypothetical protein
MPITTCPACGVPLTREEEADFRCSSCRHVLKKSGPLTTGSRFQTIITLAVVLGIVLSTAGVMVFVKMRGQQIDNEENPHDPVDCPKAMEKIGEVSCPATRLSEGIVSGRTNGCS